MNILFPLVQQALEPILSSIGLKVDDWIEHLQSSRESTQGDLTLPCFPFAKILRRNPNEIAEEIASSLTECEGIEECISVNGYVNFRASMQWLFDHLDRYKQTSIEPKDVLIEHTSANPNGPFHVGRARNAILGDTLVRLHRLAGHTVTAEYYVDDMGKQVAVLALSLIHI